MDLKGEICLSALRTATTAYTSVATFTELNQLTQDMMLAGFSATVVGFTGVATIIHAPIEAPSKVRRLVGEGAHMALLLSLHTMVALSTCLRVSQGLSRLLGGKSVSPVVGFALVFVLMLLVELRLGVLSSSQAPLRRPRPTQSERTAIKAEKATTQVAKSATKAEKAATQVAKTATKAEKAPTKKARHSGKRS